MKHWCLTFCLVIASLFGSVGEGFAYSDRNACYKNSSTCDQKNLCFYARSGNQWEIEKQYQKHVREAKRRGYTCGIVKRSLLKINFYKLSKEKRRHLQSNLKDLGLYKSSIDGLYGKETYGALKAYNKEHLGGADLKKSANATNLIKVLLALQIAEEPISKTPIVETATVTEVIPDMKVANVMAVPEVVLPENYQAGIEAYNSGDFKTAMEQAKLLAPFGNADAQFYLGKMYAEGKGTLQRNNYAHAWFNLASANGHKDAGSGRDKLAEKMTPAAVQKTQDLAAKCMESDYQDCLLIKKPKLKTEVVALPASKTVCSEGPKQCSAIQLCERAIFFNFRGAKVWKLYGEHVTEAKRRGLSCGVTINLTAIKEAYNSQSLLKRKQIQYALKKLNHYSSNIDGLYGPGTERAIIHYAEAINSNASNPSEVFNSVLNRVDVPTSFAAPKPKASTITPRTEPPKKSAQGYTKAQAEAICEPQAKLAGRNATNAYRPRNRSIDCFDFGRITSCSQGSSGGFWGGFRESMAKSRAREDAYGAIKDSCMAQYGWY